MTQGLLQRARREGAPIIDGEKATFVWRGKNPPLIAGDFNDWEPTTALRFKDVDDGVWTHTLEFPRDTYMEYAYFRGEKRVLDPFNSRTTSNGMGAFNHFFYLPDAAPTPLARRPDGPRGTVTRHLVETDQLAAGQRRTVYLYQPFTPAPCPLVVVFDGPDYLRRARLPWIVDNLIARKRIRPIALAMIDHGAQARTVEYACSEATLAFLLERVLPLARSRLNLIEVHRRPGAYGVIGASFGRLMALYAGLRLPHVFGHVLSQSGGFSAGDYDFVVVDLVRDGRTRTIRIWMDVGKYEYLLKTNRRMHALLSEKGYAVQYREYSGGHNYPSWRDDFLFDDSRRGRRAVRAPASQEMVRREDGRGARVRDARAAGGNRGP